MKQIFVLIFAFLCAAAVIRGDDELPKRLSFTPYEGMLDRSPFAQATEIAAPVTTPDIFEVKGLYVASIAHMPGEDVVILMSTNDKNFKEYLSTKQPNEHGYRIWKFEWPDRPGGTEKNK